MEASAGPHARQQWGGGMATPLVHGAQGGGMCSTHVHASTRWKDWASMPMPGSTGWRVRGCSATAANLRPVTNQGAMGVLQ